MLSGRRRGRLAVRPAAARAGGLPEIERALPAAFRRRRFPAACAHTAFPLGTFAGFPQPTRFSLAPEHPASRRQRWLPRSCAETAPASETRRRPAAAACTYSLFCPNERKLRRRSRFGRRPVV